MHTAMKTYTLTEAQRASVRDALGDVHDTDGRFAVTIELDDLNIVATGWVSIDGYTEEDTDAWVETGRAANVTLTGYTESERVEIDCETWYEIDHYLNRVYN